MRPLLACLLLSIAACSQGEQPAARPPLAGARIGGPFALVDQDGHPRTDRDYAGKYRIMYFGYTFCPDICPTDMAHIGQAMRQLRANDAGVAAKVVPIFVTVDPERDTPAVLKQFTSAFGPGIVGLTGSPDAIEAAKKGYAVFAQKGDRSAGGGYLVNHSRTAYLMGPDGAPIALLPQEGPPEGIVAEIKRWVR